MAASHHLNPNQLKLFMSGSEWQNTVTDSVDMSSTGSEDMNELWDIKLNEAMDDPSYGGHGAGIHQSMLERGYDPTQHSEYDKPTMYVHPEYKRGADGGQRQTGNPVFKQGEGHHRIAAAAHIEHTTGKPIWIPTNYKSY